jgi:hypothetical protein
MATEHTNPDHASERKVDVREKSKKSKGRKGAIKRTAERKAKTDTGGKP